MHFRASLYIAWTVCIMIGNTSYLGRGRISQNNTYVTALCNESLKIIHKNDRTFKKESHRNSTSAVAQPAKTATHMSGYGKLPVGVVLC